MTKDSNWYNRLLNNLEALHPPSSSAPIAQVQARQQRKERYALSVLGNALARERGWSLVGMDAIDFAIISKYSWYLPQVRDLPPSSKWLALHEDLHGRDIDPLALEAWNARYPSKDEVDLLDWAANPLGLPPDEGKDLSHK